MNIEEGRRWIANVIQAWCLKSDYDIDKADSNIVIDEDLAESFSNMLVERVNEVINSKKIREARKTFRDAFNDDEGFKIGYVSNVAMLLHDRYGITDYEIRNKAAEDILNLIFGRSNK